MTRIVALVAAVAAVASLAVGASTAAAAERPSLADDVAARLGISPERLREAFRSALAARIDAAVAAGRLTPAQAARLEKRIANAKGLGIGIRKGFAQKHRAFVKRVAAKGHGLGAAAAYLGMTRAELRAELRNGHSLAQIAVAKGKSVDGLVAAMLARAKERASKAVTNGRLTQQRADALLARLTERVERLVQRVPARR
ncbi:MAG TPA: hypothetical protein VFO26_08995 [Gaiella sp.]|uniref:hypothetical protein n=1 Tax=Gaiella sp. TaxID=2663207 RepID=UPI002D807413|nr:hypothetical protein [Gaiella sp.]HET9287680.1 hypothetical protein [Gaiella sp.]